VLKNPERESAYLPRKIRSNQKFQREELFNTGDNKNRQPQRC